ncbi:MAG: hypothetical protein HY770_00730 [Chitinivibrionia bacterium]|nr:hypothetical protein [Chitinivibrionia bacterium]
MGKRLGRGWMAVLAAGVCVGALAFGCGGPAERKVDVAAGEYYSEEELTLLSDRTKSRYCEDLGVARTSTQEAFDAKTRELAETNEQIKAVSGKRTDLDRERVRLEMEIQNLKDQIETVKALPDSVRIRIGESLGTIAALVNVYNDSTKWWKLLEANKNIVLDPLYCLADTTIFIPRDWPTE